MRDDFSKRTKETLAKRVNYLCSNPDCPLATVGPHSDPDKSINKGVAAHITAAAIGGKRYNDSLTPRQRNGAANGIWLCQNCAKLIDSDESRFTVELLNSWKALAESKVGTSIQSNSSILGKATSSQLNIRGSYAGGKHGTLVSITVFNPSNSPIYISAWYAEWTDHAASHSLNCVKGQLPYRLQDQDKLSLVVDLGERGVVDLKEIGIVDGENQRFRVGDTDTLVIVQEANRYSVLHKKPDTSEVEAQLRICEVEVHTRVDTSSNGDDALIVTFTNKSGISIPLTGASIEWKYDPPRTMPKGADAAAGIRSVQLVSGNVGLYRLSHSRSGVPPGTTAQFSIHRQLAGVLVETLFGDVKDDDIVIAFHTSTNVGWKANGDEIPGTIREFARRIVDLGQSA